MPEPYLFKGAVTFEEYLECHKLLAAKRRRWMMVVRVLLGVAIIVWWVVVAAPPFLKALMIFLGVFLVFHGLFLSRLQFRRRVKRNWDRYPAIHRDFEVSLSAEGMESLDDKQNPSHTAWDSLHRYGETESLFLLYLSPLLPLCLPKRLLAPNDIDGVRSLLVSVFDNRGAANG